MTPAMRHQIEAAYFLHRSGGRGGIFDEPGLGKTYSAVLYAVRHPHKALPFLAVCPASVKNQWARECHAHFGLRLRVLSGTSPQTDALGGEDGYVINYDSKVLAGWAALLRARGLKYVIIDECQNLQNPASKQTKAVRKLCQDVPHVCALSGTPMTRPIDLFATLNILRPDLFGSLHAYQQRYCDPRLKDYGWDYTGASNLSELHGILKREGVMLRRRKEDVLEMPPKVRLTVPLDVGEHPEYRDAEANFWGWLGRTRPERLAGAARSGKLAKVGYLRRLIGQLKTQAVIAWSQDFLETTGRKLLLYACHDAVLDSIQDAFGRRCVRLDGDTSMRDRDRAVRVFRADPRVTLFAANIQAGGTGLNGLTVASDVAFAELDWRPTVHSQAEDRLHRLGQTAPRVCAHYLTAAGTVEERVVQLLHTKQGSADAVIDGGAGAPDGGFSAVLKELTG